MKRLLVSFTLAIFLFPTHAVQAAASGPLVISGHPEAPPVMWEKKGMLTGIGPQLITRILEQEQVSYQLRPEGSWVEVQDKVRTGEVDILAGAYKNSQRQEYMEFSVPYLKSPVVIVVKKDNKFPFSSWNDLIGKKGVSNVGESYGEKFDAFIKEKLNVTYAPYERAFTMLAEEAADYLVIDLYPSVVYAKLLRVEDKIAYLDNPVTLQQWHITISKKSPALDLLPKINERIGQMVEQGAIMGMVKEQYEAWHATFKMRERSLKRYEMMAQQEQEVFDATAEDRGLDNLMRFVERESPYISD